MSKKMITKEQLEAYIQAVEEWLQKLKDMAGVMTEDSSNPVPPPPPTPR